MEYDENTFYQNIITQEYVFCSHLDFNEELDKRKTAILKV